jgi:hypothetical protein
MNEAEKKSLGLRVESMEDGEVTRRFTTALGALADISANLHDGTGRSASSMKELRHSREQFHRDLSVYWLELTKRGTL